MSLLTSNLTTLLKRLGLVHNVLQKRQPSQSSTQSDVAMVELVPNHHMPTSNNFNNESTKLETNAISNTKLLTKSKQHRTSLVLIMVAILLFGVSIWFIYTEFISETPVPALLQISTGHTITIVNILSHLNIFLVSHLLESAFEAMRWSLASRRKGVSIATFLALSRATGFVGVADLLRVPGRHRILCVQKLVTHDISNLLIQLC
jgi:hypothetical protein